MKVLITGGGSEEPIDNVRSVCNFSTGRTASFLADFFADSGFEVTALMAEKAVKPSRSITRVLTYQTFAQLKSALEEECRFTNFHSIHNVAIAFWQNQCWLKWSKCRASNRCHICKRIIYVIELHASRSSAIAN